MLNLSRDILNQQACITRVVCELVTDKQAIAEIRQIIQQLRAANEVEHRRISMRQIRNMLAESIMKENPEISKDRAEQLFARRLEAAMKPHTATTYSKTITPTARDLARAARKDTVKRGRGNRR